MDILSTGSGEASVGNMSFPLIHVAFRPPHIDFDLSAGSDLAKFRGVLAGDRIDGSFEQAGQRGSFSLSKSGGQPPADATAAGTPITLRTPTGDLAGTLLLPSGDPPFPLVLMISGAGQMDRDGNRVDIGARNDCLRLLALELAQRGFASVRYDKRGVAASESALRPAMHLLFSNLIDDAAAWIAQLKQDPRFAKIAVLGYDEGALVGMVAAQRSPADAFVSLVGPGAPADVLLKEKLSSQPASVKAQAFRVIDALKAGKTEPAVGNNLESIFGKEEQPFLSSKFQYDPRAEIGRLSVPVLIIGGTNDLQSSAKEAEDLHASNTGSYFDLVRGMNHVLRTVSTDERANVASYSNPDLPIDPELVQSTSEFLKRALDVPP